MKNLIKDKFSENNILRLNIISYIVIIAFLTLSLGGFYIFTQYNNYKKMLERTAREALDAKKESLKNRVEHIEQIIKTLLKNNEDFVKNAIKSHIDVAGDIVMYIYNKYYGEKSDEEIKSLIVDALRKLKFSIGDSYIWINDFNGKAILHPKLEYIEGRNVLKDNNLELKSIIEREIAFMIKNEEGLMKEKFSVSPGSPKEEHYVYLKRFLPLNLYLATAVSTKNIKRYTLENVLKLLNNKIFNNPDNLPIQVFEEVDRKNEYRNVRILVDPINPVNAGKYLDEKNIQQSYYDAQIFNDLGENGSIYIEYSNKKGFEPNNDLVYLYYFKPFRWIISIHTDLKEINTIIENGKQRLKDDLILHIIISFLLFLLFGGIAFFISLFFTNIIWHIFSNYREEINRKNDQLIFVNNELKRRLYVDTDTGLPNSYKLREDLDNVMKESEHFVIGLIHLDNFKLLSNYYGWKIGGDIYKIFVNEALKYLEKTDFSLYRYGEDSLAIMAPSKEMPQKESLEEIAYRFVEHMNSRSFILEEYDFEIDLIVYFVITYDAIYPFEALGAAIEEAKRNKLYYMVYDRFYDTLSYYENTIIWSRKVKNALNENRIVPFFQPIFDNSGHVTSYECLVRLIDENGDIMPPGFFLEITKKSNLYAQITRVMFEKCFQYFKGKNINFAINVNIEDFYDNNCYNCFINTLDTYRDITQYFTFELVESENINDYETFKKYISKLKNDYNVKFAIDDFGTGYSNFSHIINLNIDYLKIDGSLVKNLDKDKNIKIVVGSIIYFAKQLNIPTVAEFVHSKEIFQITRDLGFDYYQGFYLGGPQRELIEGKQDI